MSGDGFVKALKLSAGPLFFERLYFWSALGSQKNRAESGGAPLHPAPLTGAAARHPRPTRRGLCRLRGGTCLAHCHRSCPQLPLGSTLGGVRVSGLPKCSTRQMYKGSRHSSERRAPNTLPAAPGPSFAPMPGDLPAYSVSAVPPAPEPRAAGAVQATASPLGRAHSRFLDVVVPARGPVPLRCCVLLRRLDGPQRVDPSPTGGRLGRVHVLAITIGVTLK